MSNTETPPPNHNQSKDIEKLKHLLFEEEQLQLEKLKALLEDDKVLTQRVAAIISEAFLERSKMDSSLGEILMPQVEAAIQESVKKDTKPLVDAIFPILGPTIRKSITEAINDLIQNINDLVENSISIKSIKWRIEAWRSGKRYAEIALLRSVDYQVQQVFLIHKETGLLLHHLEAKGSFSKDPDMVSSMLSAIQDFISDTFDVAGSDTERTFRLGNFTLHVESGPFAVLATVLIGTPPQNFKVILKTTLEKIHQNFSKELVDFEGDSEVFELCRPYLSKCLISKDKEDIPKKPKLWIILPIFIGITAPLVYWSVQSYKEHELWVSTLQTIEKTPGLIILHANASEKRIVGLKDPLAPDLKSIITEDVIHALSLKAEWKSFISLDPQLMSQRINQKLAENTSKTITIHYYSNDSKTPVKTTESGNKQIGDSTAGSKSVYEISLNLGDFIPKIDFQKMYESSKTYVNGQVLLFDSGQYELNDTQKATLDELTPKLNNLIFSAHQLHRKIKIELTGFTDPVGTEEDNKILSNKRASSVLNYLRERYYPADLFVVQLAMSQPETINTNQTLESLRKVELKVIEQND